MEIPEIVALIGQARAGSANARAKLYRAFWKAARAAAYGVTGDLPSAEDAAADGLEAALLGLGGLREPEKFGPWLRRIVVRTARRGQRLLVPAIAEPWPVDGAPSAGDQLERLEAAALLRLAVERLPALLREAISLHYFEGFDVRTGATFLGVPEGTMKRRLHEGRERLRAYASTVFEGGSPLGDAARQSLVERLGANADPAALYGMLKEAMSIRPFPRDIVTSISRRVLSSAGNDEKLREIHRRYEPVSDRARNAADPVGGAAIVLRRAFPEFLSWDAPAGEFPLRTSLDASLPPGFTAGVAGAYVRAGRGLLHLDADGIGHDPAVLVTKSASLAAFAVSLESTVSSDVLDLYWMDAPPMELTAVHALVERLLRALPADTRIVSILPHASPRYRAALRVDVQSSHHLGAIGGIVVLQGIEFAHVRVFLEPWAERLSGCPVPLLPLSLLAQQLIPRT